MNEYQPSTILPPGQGTSKFGGTQSRIIMGGVNCQKLGANMLPGLLIAGEQYGIVTDGEKVARNASANPDVIEIQNAWSLMSDEAVLNSAVAVVDYDPETLAYDPESGVLTGVTTVAFEAGTAYWCKEIVTIEEVQMYVYEPTVAGRDVREVYEAVQPISQAANVYNVGMPQLAAQISAKGVPCNAQDGLSVMAQKVGQIPQQLNTRTSDFEQMTAPSPYMWNVYTVATDLMKETLPDYLPSYMQEYKQQYGTNAFFVGEYYRGYDSLELTGADGYLTHDGCFYTIADGVVTRTAPDGTVSTYEAESIIHTWLNEAGDTYTNRWIAFFYLADGYGFTNSNSAICPRRVTICGNCSSFIISGENRLTDVWVTGTLGTLQGGTTGNSWNPAQSIRHLSNVSAAIYTDPSNVKSIVLPDTETMTVDALNLTSSNSSVEVVCYPKLSSDPIKRDYQKLTALKYFYTSEKGSISIGASSYLNFENAGVEVHIPGITSIAAAGWSYFPIILGIGKCSIYADDLVSMYPTNLPIVGNGNNRAVNVTTIYCPKYTGWFRLVAIGNNKCDSLIDLWLGATTYNIDCMYWTAENIIADATKKAQLIENIKNHILARVSDATGGTRLVFTVSTNLYNNIASEQIEWQGETMTLADAFLTKNWLLAGA